MIKLVLLHQVALEEPVTMEVERPQRTRATPTWDTTTRRGPITHTMSGMAINLIMLALIEKNIDCLVGKIHDPSSGKKSFILLSNSFVSVSDS